MSAFKRVVRLLAGRPHTKPEALEAVTVPEQQTYVATPVDPDLEEKIKAAKNELVQGVMKMERRAADIKEELGRSALVLLKG